MLHEIGNQMEMYIIRSKFVDHFGMLTDAKRLLHSNYTKKVALQSAKSGTESIVVPKQKRSFLSLKFEITFTDLNVV